MLFSDAPAIKRIQSGVASPSSAGSINVTIDSVDLSKSILFFTVSNNASDFNGITIGRFTSSTNIEFDWYTVSLSGTIRWYVMEFARGVNVQHIYQEITSNTTIDINKVDLNKAFILTDFASNNNADSILSKFNSTGTGIEVTYNSSATYASFQVIEWNGAKVQLIDTGAFTAASKDETINEVDLKHALLFGSHIRSGNGNDDISVAHLSSSTNLQFNKYIAGDSERHMVFVVELPEFNIQSGRKSIASTVSSATETVNPVFSSHTFPLIYNRGDHISQGDQVGIRTDRGSYNLSLSGTTLTFTRDSGSGDTYVSWFVAEYKEHLAIRKIKNYVSTGDYSSSTNYNVDVDEFTPEKTWHWAWADEERESGSYRFDIPGTKVIDEDTINVMIANNYSTGDFDPKFILVEFDTGVTIQHLLDPGANRPETIDINPVDLDRAGIFAQMVDDCGSDGFDNDRGQEYTFNDSDTVGIDNSTNTNNRTAANIQVLEFHDSHNRVVEDNTLASTVDKAITRLDPKKSFLIGYSWQNSSTLDCDELKTLLIDATDNISLDANTSKQLDITAYPIMIDGPSNVRVQHKTATLTGASTTISIDAVKTDRSFIRINGWNGCLGSTTSGDDDSDTASLQCVATFNSSTEVLITRESAATRNVDISISVIEVDSYPIEKFKRKCKLTIQGSQIAATGTYPVHLSFDGSDSTKTNLPSEMFDADGDHPSQPNGGDIRVTSDAAGTTLLPLEIVYWKTDDDTANAKGEAWVRVDLTASTDKDIYIWWDAPGNVQQPSPWLDEGAYQVWPDDEYAFVCHCAGFDVNTDGEGYWDSTQRGRTPDAIHGVTFDSRQDSVCGVGIGGGTSGSDTNIRFNTNSEMEALADAAYTAYILTKDVGDLDTDIAGVGETWFDAGQNAGPFKFERKSLSDELRVVFGDQDSSSVTIDLTGFTANTEVFGVAGQSSSDVPFVSINGGSRSTGSFGTGPISGTNRGQITMFNSKNNGSEWAGDISEFIIKFSDDGADWDTTFYRTMTDADGFIVPSTPESAWGHSVPVTKGLIAQYDPSYSSSVELDSGNIEYLKDLANNYHAYKDDDHNTPNISSSLWNDLDTINFDQSNQETLALPWFPIHGSQARFIFIVAKTTTTGTDRTILCIGQPTSEEQYDIRANNSNTNLEVYNADAVINATSFAWDDGPAVYGVNHDGTADLGGTWLYFGNAGDSSLDYEDISAPGGNDDINTVQGDGEDNFLGWEAVATNDDYWDGQVAEILIYDRNLTSDERTAIFTYLKDKWLSSDVVPLRAQEYGQLIGQIIGQL